MTSLAIATAVKVSVLLAAALTVDTLLRSMPARLRHLAWTGWFGAFLALPLLIATLPPVAVAFQIDATAPAAPEPLAAVQPLPLGPAVAQSLSSAASEEQPWYAPQRPAKRITVSTVLLSIWALGAVLATAMVVLSAWRVRALVRASSDLVDKAWIDAARAASARAGLKQVPRLRVHHSVGTPMAGGWRRPTIFLPPSAQRWKPDWRDVVLAHEVAHLSARDSLRHLMVRLTLALYWCHPLAWLAARRAACAREQACDEAVVSSGTRSSAYARVLLELSDTLRPQARLPGAVAIIEGSLLEKRLRHIVSTRRRPFGKAILGILLSLILSSTTILAALRPASAPPAALPHIASPALGDVVRQALLAPLAPVDAPGAPSLTSRAAQTVSDRPTGIEASRGNQNASCEARWQGEGPAIFSATVGPNVRRGASIRWKSDTPWISMYDGDLRACMASEFSEPGVAPIPPSRQIAQASHFLMESSLGSSRQALEVTRARDGETVWTWSVDGIVSPQDHGARRWRDQMLIVLDAAWDAAILRDQDDLISSRIKSLETQRSNILAEVTSLEAGLASAEDEVSLLRQLESLLRSRSAEIRRHERSLTEALASSREMERTLGFRLRSATGAEREEIGALVAAHAEDTARLERALVEHAADARVAALDRELDALDASAAIAAMGAAVDEPSVQQRIAALERELNDLDVDQRVSVLVDRRRQLDLRNRMAIAASLRDRNFQWLRTFIGQLR